MDRRKRHDWLLMWEVNGWRRGDKVVATYKAGDWHTEDRVGSIITTSKANRDRGMVNIRWGEDPDKVSFDIDLIHTSMIIRLISHVDLNAKRAEALAAVRVDNQPFNQGRQVSSNHYSLVCPAKERPAQRRMIIAQKLRPFPSVREWNGYLACDSNGDRVWLSGGLKTQMRKMVREGFNWETFTESQDEATDLAQMAKMSQIESDDPIEPIEPVDLPEDIE